MQIPILESDEKILRYIAGENQKTLVVKVDCVARAADLTEGWRYWCACNPAGGEEFAVYTDDFDRDRDGFWGGLSLTAVWHAGLGHVSIECHVSLSSGPQKRITHTWPALKSLPEACVKAIAEGYKWAHSQGAPLDIAPDKIELIAAS